MTVMVGGTFIKWLAPGLRVVQRVMFIAGLCLSSWPLFVSAESLWAQWSAERELAAMSAKAAVPRTDHQEAIIPSKPGAARPTVSHRGSVLGRFEIPRLQLSYALLEGTDNRTLDKSIGHVEGTGLPGEIGNIGIAGHRNTHFRKLEWIQRGDEIIVSSPRGRFRYVVEWARLFTPGDIEVLDVSHGPAVTLITCFPFEYVGAAPLRLIVRALPDAETRAVLIPNGAPTRKAAD